MMKMGINLNIYIKTTQIRFKWRKETETDAEFSDLQHRWNSSSWFNSGFICSTMNKMLFPFSYFLSLSSNVKPSWKKQVSDLNPSTVH